MRAHGPLSTASEHAIKEVAMMKKTIAATAIALTLAGASFALAQQATQSSPAREGRGFRSNAEDVAAFTDARVAGLKAGLKLTAEQEKNWPAVETAIRDLAKDRGDRMKERAARREARRGGGDNAQQAGPDAISRLRQGADAMTARAASLKKLADASEPLYKSLDEGQKHRFAMLLREGGRPGGAGHHWQRRADNAR
jgi:zinc resistance-associated protein